ncbi:MAG: hypothetical protein KBA57_09560 [Sphingomonadaceae bacterium]|nr:hypothetical protein [Sphingomonadaceae bacterium]
MNWSRFLVAVLAMLQAGDLTAQDASPSSLPQACELHVWPSSGLRSIYHGWWHGGIVDGAVTQRDGYPPVPADPIDSRLQANLLSQLDLPGTLGLAQFKTVIHEEPLASREARSGSARLVASQTPCYAELIADDVFFQQDVVNGSSLKTLFRFRDFGDAQSPLRSFSTWARTPLKLFPPKTPADNEPSLTELQGAYRNNAVLFGGYLAKAMLPPKGKAK